jgi:hypothetical protein
MVMPATSAHFNGSVNLADTETVMREISGRVPEGVRRVPDGETGPDRSNWIFFQLQRFTGNPHLEIVRADADPEAYETPRVRLAEGADPETLTWPDLGYADVYLESYQTFARLRDEGVIAAGARFQVQYPTPLASIGAYVVPEHQHLVLPSYERAMFADLGRLVAAIPYEDLAVQWDVAIEFGILVGGFGPAAPELFDMIVANLVRCADQVPADVPAGLHLCYGDYGHQHFRQPESLELQVRVLNGVTAGAARPVSFVSFTVPQNQQEESYFAPLAGLAAGPETELNFALVPYHPAQQPAGTTRQQARLIDAALAKSANGGRAWGICTECGMGRVDRDDVPVLLDRYREILAAGH